MFNITSLISMLLARFAAQFIDGTLGMGYGMSSTSLLVAIGLAPAIACASMHTAEIVTAFGEECTPAMQAGIPDAVEAVWAEIWQSSGSSWDGYFFPSPLDDTEEVSRAAK
jgi:hypothetical protein